MTVTRRKSRGWTDRDRAREKVLLAQMRDSEVGSADHQAARDELVTMHLPLVTHLARRLPDRGEPHDDLVQVGTVGLIKAVDRFDTDRGVELTFATPTIAGEIKRHFRDRGWSIRVPRRLQEMRQDIGRKRRSCLSAQATRRPSKRSPTAPGGIRGRGLEGLEGAQAYSTLSLDSPAGCATVNPMRPP